MSNELVPVASGTVTAATVQRGVPQVMDTKVLIHIGNPMLEEPHKSLERAQKMHVEAPNVRLVCLVWEESDYKQLDAALDKSYSSVIMWDDDMKLQAYLLDHLIEFIGAMVVGPRWYKCPDNHVQAGTYKELQKECEVCKKPIELVEPLKQRLERFAELFGRVLHLSNFDTRSGQWLLSNVNPMRNIFLNMRYALGCPHETIVEPNGAAIGKTVIICGAGPSLEDAIPHLRRLQDTCIIMAVGRAYKLLHASGVRVDYVASVEMFEWDAAIFDDVEDVGDTVLVFASVCAHETVKKWPGKKVCMWDAETAKVLDIKEWIFGGNSVAHHMLNYSAQILKADEIVMAGIDLAYTKPRTHAMSTTPTSWPKEVREKDEAYHEEEWVPCTAKGQDFHPECHMAPCAIQGGFAPGPIHVRSSPAYKDFAILFEILIAKHGKKVWNACPNGQKIGGAEFLDISTYRLTQAG